MSQNIDPIVFARFMVMDGATRLVTAFSGIPEGPLRESVIHMAETMRETYAGAPARHQPPDPLHGALGASFAAPPPPPERALPGPGPKTEDPMVRAVQLRLEGKFPHEIAKETGLKIGAVYKAIGEARKAGVKLPDIGRAKAGLTERGAAYITNLDQITSSVQMGSVNRAAQARGIDAEAYVGRRKLALDMALEGRHIRAIIAATGEDKGTLSQWFHVAREAGHPVPYMVDQQFIQTVSDDAPPQPEGSAVVVPMKPRVWRRSKKTGEHNHFIVRLEDYEKANPMGRQAIDKGARMKGVDVPEYLRLRRETITMFDTGATAQQVAEVLGLTLTQASNWRERAQTAGLLGFRQQRKG